MTRRSHARSTAAAMAMSAAATVAHGQAAPVSPAPSAAVAAGEARAVTTPDRYAPFRPQAPGIKFTLPENIPWTGTPGRSQQYRIIGDPSKPGLYVMLIKWWPNQFSRPHIHAKPRYFTVISGTWWMSSSPVYDPEKTYPMPAGTTVVHEANAVHWDGAKSEPAILMVAGEGPATTISVDAQGRPETAAATPPPSSTNK